MIAIPCGRQQFYTGSTPILDRLHQKQLQRSNPEAFKNVVRRLLEAAGRGMWDTDDDTLDRLKELYGDADDMVEQSTSLTGPSISS